VGVDTLYFQAMIQSLRKQIDKNEKLELTSDYICSIVDKIF
jgi:hypothetical protein